MANVTPEKKTANYYQKLGSRLGYRLVMKRSQHFGYYDRTHTDEDSAQQHYHEQFAKLLRLQKGMKILDAGCGQGVVACFVAQVYDVHVTGVTITPHEVKSADKRAVRLNVQNKTKFLQADYAKMPFGDATFDRIYTTESLSHAFSVDQVLAEFMRVLKPGGLIVCAEYEMDYTHFDEETMRLSTLVKEHAAIHGMYQFGKDEFSSTIHRNGFRNLKVYDWTEHTKPSFDRLRRLARPFVEPVKILHLDQKFINVVAASMYSDGVENGVFKYKVYVASK